MDSASGNRSVRYDRVMPRVHSRSHSSLKSSSFVTRHERPSSVRVGANVSNVNSGVFSELPLVLNDFVPDSERAKVKRTFVKKPRKTVKSLDPALSPIRSIAKSKELIKKPAVTRLQESAPSVLETNGEKWSSTHLRECMSSRTHSKLQELKDEIKAYKETEKLMRLRSNLFKKCGVVLDDVGNVAEDKAVQVEVSETGSNVVNKHLATNNTIYNCREAITYKKFREHQRDGASCLKKLKAYELLGITLSVKYEI